MLEGLAYLCLFVGVFGTFIYLCCLVMDIIVHPRNVPETYTLEYKRGFKFYLICGCIGAILYAIHILLTT